MTEEKSIDQVETTFKVAAAGTRYSVIDLPTTEEHLNEFIKHIAPGKMPYEVIRVECPLENAVVNQLSLPYLNRLAGLWKENNYSEKYALQLNVAFYEDFYDTPEEADKAAKEITILEIGSGEVADMGYYMARRIHAREFERAEEVMKEYFDYEQYGMGLIANSRVRLIGKGLWHLRY